MAHSYAAASFARPERTVERKASRSQFLQSDSAIGTAVARRIYRFLAVDFHGDHAVGKIHGGFDGIGKSAVYVLFDDKSVNDDVDGMLEVFAEFYIFVQRTHFAVHLHAHKAHFAVFFEKVFKFTLFCAHNGRGDYKLCSFGRLHYLGVDFIHAQLCDLSAAHGAMRNTDVREQQS